MAINRLIPSLLALALGTGNALATDGTWILDGSADWSNNTTAWQGNQIADGVGATATFDTVSFTSNRNITLDTARTVGILKLGNGGNRTYNLIGANILTLDNGASAANINFKNLGQNANLAVAVALKSNLLITNLDTGGDKGFFFTAGLSSINGDLTITNTSNANSRTKFNSVISDGTGTITFNQTAGWSEFTDANTFTGSTTNGGGLLNLGAPLLQPNNSLALQNSALDTAGSIAGDATNGLRIYGGITTLTLGGLTGDKNFAATGGVFSTATSNYGVVTALTLNPGTGKSHSYSGVIADGAAGMSLTKTGAGTQILTNSNTYSGATNINGGTLVITGATQATSAITFGGGVLGLDIATPVTAASATVDFTGQSVLVTGTPTLASYTLLTASSITGTAPTLAAPAPSGYTLQVFGGNQLRLVQTGGGTPYDTWAATNAPSPQTPDQDYDGDGVSNAVEFVLGGDKDINDLGKLPGLTTSGGNMLFTFKRDQDSIDSSTSVEIEVSTTLASWPTSYTVGTDTAGSDLGVTVSQNDPVSGTDTVTLSVAQSPDAKKFARLKVVITP